MPDYPGKTIVSKIMQGLTKDSLQICRDTGLPMFEVIALTQGRMAFNQDFADKFGTAYPAIGVSASGWMTMQTEYDDAALVWIPNHPGWYVVTRIMRGCYDSEGVYCVLNNKEMADKLNIDLVTFNDLINWRIPIDLVMAQKLVAVFPATGIDEAKWLELQVNYDENYVDPYAEGDKP